MDKISAVLICLLVILFIIMTIVSFGNHSYFHAIIFLLLALGFIAILYYEHKYTQL